MSQLEDTLGHPIHPSALALFTGASEVLVELDLGPLNSDPGHDAMTEFQAGGTSTPTRPSRVTSRPSSPSRTRSTTRSSSTPRC